MKFGVLFILLVLGSLSFTSSAQKKKKESSSSTSFNTGTESDVKNCDLINGSLLKKDEVPKDTSKSEGSEAKKN